MHRLARAAIAVIPLLGALACGGRVGDVGGGGPACPSPSAVAPGVACASAGQVCVETTDECDTIGSADCTCTDGVWGCPAVGTPKCVSIDAGPPNVCPVAAAVIQGDPCDVPQQLSCSSDTPIYDCSGNVEGNASCECFDGQWSCEEPGPYCPPVDASTGCPAPDSIAQGVPCSSQEGPAGAVCPGNPTLCDGATFYDGFECTNGAWNDVAVTGCSSDGGGHTLDAGGAGSD